MRSPRPILHPFLFSAYAVLSLWAFNIHEISPSETIRPLLACILFALALLLLSYWHLHDWDRSALLASLVLILFFSYGHVYYATKNIALGDFLIGRHRYLASMWAILALGCYFWIRWRVTHPKRFTNMLNIIAIVAIIQPLFGIVSDAITDEPSTPHELSAQFHIDPSQANGEPEHLPDVYFIVMDAYAREDVLKDLYGYDNATFLKYLRDNGFFVADNSISNYAQTELSLTAILNLNYLEEVLGPLDPTETDRRPFKPVIHHSVIRQLFEEMGYLTVAFDTGYSWTTIRDVDLYLEPSPPALTALETFKAVNPFEGMLIQTSAGVFVRDMLYLLSNTSDMQPQYPYQRHRERILFTLEHLATLPPTNEPKFVFAHIVSPHLPFVFGPDGEIIPHQEAFTLKAGVFLGDRETYIQRYTDQLTYLNQRLMQTIDVILTTQETPPIIILLSDHGPDVGVIDDGPSEVSSSDERFSILYAVLSTACGDLALYDSMSSVNTFRALLNMCYGADMDLLEDRSYLSSYYYPFNLHDVTDHFR
jgi:hypothetical protein